MEEILERQLLIRGRAFATFSIIEKVLAGRKKSFLGRHADRLLCGPVQGDQVCCTHHNLLQYDVRLDLHHRAI